MSQDFLKENGLKPEITTTNSGLQYRVVKKGKGKFPRINDTVKVHYVGKLVSGNEFDSSYKRGKPAVFKVNGVIKGWTEALLMMQKGSKWEIFIPPELGYGNKGVPDVIPSNAVLIFELELIKPRKSLFGF
ncbi:MAG: FKBP-type peptidyl-prolyl cis-trans isomerase [Deltaproteobacteria bacterium]|jgi:FKBP-type peptidyl-prolyl cis-trans isomerase|nr:FKBP-type peptidyl-prolyl cis-trans isomerase [Deltaproteobacteria bacterium]